MSAKSSIITFSILFSNKGLDAKWWSFFIVFFSKRSSTIFSNLIHLMAFLIFWVFIALLAGWSGYNRTIGFWMAFLLSLLLWPVGWLVIIFSRKVYLTQWYQGQQPVSIQYIPKHKPVVEEKSPDISEVDILKKDKLVKLLDEWADGKITEEEYKIKKERIMLL